MNRLSQNIVIDLNRAIIQDVLFCISQNRIRSVYLKGSSGILVGVVTEGDVIRGLLSGLTTLAPVMQIYNKSFSYVVRSEDHKSDKERAISIMLSKNLVSIPIVDKDFCLCEVITFDDLLEMVKLDK